MNLTAEIGATTEGLQMVSRTFSLNSVHEKDAFFGAFFKFVEAAAVMGADSMSMRTEPMGHHEVKVVTFAEIGQADQFQTYWSQRRRWLGL
jgi:hypothetical protein